MLRRTVVTIAICMSGCSFLITTPPTAQLTTKTELDCSAVYPALDGVIAAGFITSGVLVFKAGSDSCEPDNDGEPCPGATAGLLYSLPLFALGVGWLGVVGYGFKLRNECEALQRKQHEMRQEWENQLKSLERETP